MSALLNKIQQENAKKEAEKAALKPDSETDTPAPDAPEITEEVAVVKAPVVQEKPEVPTDVDRYKNLRGKKIIISNGSIMKVNLWDGLLHAATKDEKAVCAYFAQLGHLELVK